MINWLEKIHLKKIIIIATFFRSVVLWITCKNLLSAVRSDNYLKIAEDWLSSGIYGSEIFSSDFFMPLTSLILKGLLIIFEPKITIFIFLLFQNSIALLIVWMSFNLGKLISYKVGIISAILVAINPLAILYSNVIFTETFFTFFQLVSIYFIFKIIKKESTCNNPKLDKFFIKHIIISAFFACLAMYTRANAFMIYVSAIMAWFYLGYKKKNLLKYTKGIFIFIVVFYIGLFPWIQKNYSETGQIYISKSSTYNFVAITLGGAKRSINNKPGMLGPWEDELSTVPNIDQLKPSEQAKVITPIAMDWVLKNPSIVIKSGITSQAKMLFAPGKAIWKEKMDLVNIPPKIQSLFIFTITLYRIGIFILFVIGSLFLFFKKKNISYLIFIVTLILLNFVSVGTGGYSRFVVPLLPYFDLLAAIGLYYGGNHLNTNNIRSRYGIRNSMSLRRKLNE